jgi:hypothetical protein
MPILWNAANVSTADKFSYRRNETAIHKAEKYFLFPINKTVSNMPILWNIANVSTADELSYRRNETAMVIGK